MKKMREMMMIGMKSLEKDGSEILLKLLIFLREVLGNQNIEKIIGNGNEILLRH